MTAPRVNEPTIPGLLLSLLLALLAILAWPVVWGMRQVGKAGERLTRKKVGQ